jgi:hypothetical protein
MENLKEGCERRADLESVGAGQGLLYLEVSVIGSSSGIGPRAIARGAEEPPSRRMRGQPNRLRARTVCCGVDKDTSSVVVNRVH